jgi:hypothetical protein
MARLAPIHWKRLENVFFAVGGARVRDCRNSLFALPP